MTHPAPGSKQFVPAGRPLFWAGLLLNLLLPGSGFSVQGRPWRHLVALLLTLLDWFAAWMLALYVSYAGLATAPALPRTLATALVLLGGLLVVVAYGLLTWSYLRAARASVPAAFPATSARGRWWPVLLHLAAVLYLILAWQLGLAPLF